MTQSFSGYTISTRSNQLSYKGFPLWRVSNSHLVLPNGMMNLLLQVPLTLSPILGDRVCDPCRGHFAHICLLQYTLFFRVHITYSPVELPRIAPRVGIEPTPRHYQWNINAGGTLSFFFNWVHGRNQTKCLSVKLLQCTPKLFSTLSRYCDKKRSTI